MEKLTFKLETFEGPLDLLLNLISTHKLDIYDIEISKLLEQYLLYIDNMKQMDLYVASEFLEMAARLVYIKTVSLLPKHEEVEQLKAELTGELLEYQLCKEVAKNLSERNQSDDMFVREQMKIKADMTYKNEHKISELFEAYIECIGKTMRRLPPPKKAFSGIVATRIVSVSSRIIFILNKLYKNQKAKFIDFFRHSDRPELVATFLGMLELIKAKRIVVSDDCQTVNLNASVPTSELEDLQLSQEQEWK